MKTKNYRFDGDVFIFVRKIVFLLKSTFNKNLPDTFVLIVNFSRSLTSKEYVNSFEKSQDLIKSANLPYFEICDLTELEELTDLNSPVI